MLLADVAIGLLVRRHGGEHTLVRDWDSGTQPKGPPRPRRVGRIISEPARYGPSTHRKVKVQWVGTDLVETIAIQRLEIMPNQYRRRTAVVQAVRLPETSDTGYLTEDWLETAITAGDAHWVQDGLVVDQSNQLARWGDWIVHHENGALYCFKPEHFEQIYEKI